VASIKVGSLGDYIREQRQHAQVSLRQLAKSAGVSNPYLSQVERGLKKPSAEMLQQIAKGLRISAETLYVHAGILDERTTTSDVVGAILADDALDDRQKRVLLDVYDSFRHENASREQSTAARRNAAKKTASKKSAATKTATTKTAATKTAVTRATPKKSTSRRTTS
jgi:transcriptional regulator with XRE-family HTH domain